MSRLSATSVFFLERPRLKTPADGDGTSNADGFVDSQRGEELM